jgi:hypothetical protein
MEVAMNEEMLTEPLELAPAELYAVAGGHHIGYHRTSHAFSDPQVNISLISVVVEIGNGNRVAMGSASANGSDNGKGNVDIGNGNEITIFA